MIVCADREADIYEVFAERENRLASGQSAASWLIRSKTNRCLEPFEEGQEEPIAPPVKGAKKPSRLKIQQQMEQSPVLGTITFAISAKEQFKKVKGGSRKKVQRSRRIVTQEIRAIQIMRQLRHPHLTRIDQVWCHRGYIVITMEKAEGSLLDLLDAYQFEYSTPIRPEYV